MRPKSVREKIAIRKSQEQKANRAEYQYVANQVREKRKHPTLAESLEALRKNRESQPTPNSGDTYTDEQKMPFLKLGTQLSLFEDLLGAMILD